MAREENHNDIDLSGYTISDWGEVLVLSGMMMWRRLEVPQPVQTVVSHSSE
jgi:hypothetical protein